MGNRTRHSKRFPARPAAVVVAACLLAGGVAYASDTADSTTLTLQFTEAKGLYEGDAVTMLDVPVGKVTGIEVKPTHVDVEVVITDEDVTIPDNVRAILVAPSLVSIRRVELTGPEDAGSPIADESVVPLSRTTTPVEWDQIKEELVRVTEALGPDGANSDGALNRALAVSADNLRGQGVSLSKTIRSLSEAMSTLADGGDDLFATVRNLQVFATALEQSDAEIVSFNQRFASVTGSLAEDDQALRRALAGLAKAFPRLQRFIKTHRTQATAALKALMQPASNLAAQRQNLGDILQVAPGTLSNFYAIMDPNIPGPTGTFALANFSNAAEFLCGATLSLGGTAAQCRDLLEPVAQYLNLPAPPVGLSPLIRDGRDNVEDAPWSTGASARSSTSEDNMGASMDNVRSPSVTGSPGDLRHTVDSLLGGGQ